MLPLKSFEFCGRSTKNKHYSGNMQKDKKKKNELLREGAGEDLIGNDLK